MATVTRLALVVLVSLVQEGVVGIQLCVHPVDIAGEIFYGDHEKYGTEMRALWYTGRDWLQYRLTFSNTPCDVTVR